MGEIIMPTELTSENGAKCAFIGEFKESIELECPQCNDEGYDIECDICNGSGTYMQNVVISWTNIKAIYKKAVKMFGQTI